jgi:cyclophilin family peptidyl-prolyl cis-trans isomerase/HEAT repeat protein
MSLRFVARTLALAPLLAACGATDWIREQEHLTRPGGDDPGQDLAPGTEQRALATIAQLEDARDDGGGYLQLLIGHGTPAIRARAALALGRLPLAHYGSSVTGALARALGDEDPEVRATAAFALGMRGDGGAAAALVEAAGDAHPAVRARVVEAASRVDAPLMRRVVLDGLDDPELAVRVEAALGPHRWPADGDDPGVDAALLRALAGAPRGGELAWRLCFTLQRRRVPAAADAFQSRLAQPDAAALERLHAAKGLANLLADGTTPCDAALVALLGRAATADADLRVAVEALRGLAHVTGDEMRRRALEPLAEAARHPSFHVRAAACEALGAFDTLPAPVASLLEAARADASRTVRVAGLVAEARVRAAAALPSIRARMQSDDVVMRAGAAQAAAALPAGNALPLLLELSRDAHPRVAGVALSALGAHADDASRARLLEVVTANDNGLRVAALDALASQLRPEDARVLRASFESARGDIATEVRVSALRAAGSLGTDEALALAGEGVLDPHPFVAQVARDVLLEHDRHGDGPRYEPSRLREVPLPGRDYDPDARPRVELRTSRGALVFELFPGEAPLHVHSFLELARRGHYDGLSFHRVVSDFVVQGGCYRGDGNGSGTWRGPDDALRHEIGPRKYVRGSLGMPRNEDLESGGSQIFVCHRATPHLDGRYTIFGELRAGFDVLDVLEVGDTILAVRVL